MHFYIKKMKKSHKFGTFYIMVRLGDFQSLSLNIQNIKFRPTIVTFI